MARQRLDRPAIALTRKHLRRRPRCVHICLVTVLRMFRRHIRGNRQKQSVNVALVFIVQPSSAKGGATLQAGG